MFDIKLIREDAAAVEEQLLAKNVKVNFKSLLKLDEKKRSLGLELEELRAEQNKANDEISVLLKEKKDPKKKIAAMKGIAKEASALEPKVKKLSEEISDILINIPNLPHSSVPAGGVDGSRLLGVRLEMGLFRAGHVRRGHHGVRRVHERNGES